MLSTLPSLNTDFYGWQLNVVPKWFSGKQLEQYRTTNSNTDLKKKNAKTKPKDIPQIMLTETRKKKEKKIDCNT